MLQHHKYSEFSRHLELLYSFKKKELLCQAEETAQAQVLRHENPELGFSAQIEISSGHCSFHLFQHLEGRETGLITRTNWPPRLDQNSSFSQSRDPACRLDNTERDGGRL